MRSGSDFTPIQPNPFIVGNPVRERKMFFGREDDFELVRKRFRDTRRGAILVFCGERRSGKTSILFQIMEGRLGDEFISVLLDMQSMAVEDEADFLHRIAREVSLVFDHKALDIDESGLRAAKNPAGVFRDFIESELKRHPEKKLVLLVDEYELLENKIDAGLLSDDVLLVLANLMENHPVYIIFTGSQTLEERERRYWRILGASEFRRISYLSSRDAFRLIKEPVEGRVVYETGLVESIYRLTAGQPFYTQAVCQKLVDALNERQTGTATKSMLDDVAREIIDNPFPQMTFLWDSLDLNDRFALSVLAEALESADTTLSPNELAERCVHRKFPITPGAAEMSTALEALFQRELLNKSDEGEFNFKMDIWRLWIHRMRSPWQVMREAGIDVRRGRKSPNILLLAGLVAILAVVSFFILQPRIGHDDSRPVSSSNGVSKEEIGGIVAIRITPPEAQILFDSVVVAGSSYDLTLPITEHPELLLTAQGYVDSLVTVSASAESTTSYVVDLRRERGSVRIRTTPDSAEVIVNGTGVGRSPAVVHGLPSGDLHRTTVSAARFQRETFQFKVVPDSLIDLTFRLQAILGTLRFNSHPIGAQVSVDGEVLGSTPLAVTDLTLGSHDFTLVADGHLQADTTLVATEDARDIYVELLELPAGVLIVQGDVPALIYVGDQLVKQGYVQNSGPCEVRPGLQPIRVRYNDGTVAEGNVEVASAERVVFDFSSMTVSSRVSLRE